MIRILITGSRWWNDWAVPYYALAAEWHLTGGKAILVSGHCPPRADGTPGADYICEQIWRGFGGMVEEYPADWSAFGKSAGFRRNCQMAALPGVYKCLAFNLNNSNGTRHCTEQARNNNIPVSPFERCGG
jgi:hypothetical protein